MADYTRIIPLILQVEGGLSKAKTDAASADPVPDGTGNHTNKGFTWTTFKRCAPLCGFIATPELFYSMPDYVWNPMFKMEYWDMIMGDKIQSQALADTLLDWSFMSGAGTAIKQMQKFLKMDGWDGIMGPNTLNAINTSYNFGIASPTEREINDGFTAFRLAWFQALKGTPSDPQGANQQGWANRIQKIKDFTDSEIQTPNT